MLHDIRYAMRGLLRSPGFATAAILTLAVGIGAEVAGFSALNSVLLRALPYAEGERIVLIWGTGKGGDREQVSFTDVADFRAQSRTLEEVAPYTQWRPVLTGHGEPQRVPAALVGDGFFAVMGGSAAMGRTFMPEEQQDGADDVVVLGHALWQSRFGGDPDVVGTSVHLNGRAHTVVGVMPADFRPLPASLIGQPELLYRPVAESYDETMRSARHLRAVARLESGVDLDAAQRELSLIAERLEREHPEDNAGQGVRLASLREDTVGGIRPALLMLFGAVSIVLLIGCANVANLLLARSSTRGGELSIRAALGASRRRLVGQALTESAVLAVCGGTVGLVLALWATSLLRSLGMGMTPLLAAVEIDLRVLAFALVVSMVTAIAFGAAPAAITSRTDPAGWLREGSRGSLGSRRARRARGGLVVIEIALALLLLIGASLLVRSLLRLQNVPPGFEKRNALTMNVWLPSARYPNAEAQLDFFGRLESGVAALPGVEAVGFTSVLPFGGNHDRVGVEVEGRDYGSGEAPNPDRYTVTPDYFAAMGIRLVDGRLLTEEDDARAAPVILISETMANRLWPGEDPIGARIRLPYSPAPTNPWRTVVGVVGDVRQYGLDRPGTMQIYLPQAQYPWPYMTLVARTRVPPQSIAGAVRAEIRALDDQQAVFDVATLESLVAGSIAVERFAFWILGGFAAVSVLLSMVGIYGVIAYSVARRTPEFGLRLALGAQAGSLRRLTLAEATPLVAVGIAIGLAGALILTRTLDHLLFEISSLDVVSFALATAAVAAVALAACLVPARRAARVSPMTALRSE